MPPLVCTPSVSVTPSPTSKDSTTLASPIPVTCLSPFKAEFSPSCSRDGPILHEIARTQACILRSLAEQADAMNTCFLQLNAKIERVLKLQEDPEAPSAQHTRGCDVGPLAAAQQE